MTTSEIGNIADVLIDFQTVDATRKQQMQDAIRTYKKATTFLGYCSRLKAYSTEFETLTSKLMLYRADILMRYKDELIVRDIKLLKALLIPPMKTFWYTRGVLQYKNIRKYCIEHYGQKLQLIVDCNDQKNIYRCVDTIIKIDKHYDIYADTVGRCAGSNKNFASLMNARYMSYVQL